MGRQCMWNDDKSQAIYTRIKIVTGKTLQQLTCLMDSIRELFATSKTLKYPCHIIKIVFFICVQNNKLVVECNCGRYNNICVTTCYASTLYTCYRSSFLLYPLKNVLHSTIYTVLYTHTTIRDFSFLTKTSKII